MHDIKNTSGVKLTMRTLRARIVKLLSPVAADEDRRRRELVLNVILIISIPFLTFADILIGRNTLRMGELYHGVPFWISTVVVIIFIILFVLSKKGYARSTSYIVIGIYTLCAMYSGWHWGASLPSSLLAIVLVSVISSLLISSRFGFFMSGILLVGLTLSAHHEATTLGLMSWKYQTINTHDVFIYSAILLFISALSWLSNKEIEKSLRRARTSEKSLAIERDILEIKVAERTEALRASQEERIAVLSQRAEFGRMSQGLFHDLMTPLTSVALHMETLRDVTIPEIQNSRAYVEKAMLASQRMGTFMSYIRRTIRSASPTTADCVETNEKVDLCHELRVAIDLLSHKTRSINVQIETVAPVPVYYAGNSLHFLQIFLNLLSNAIDACEYNTDLKCITVMVHVKTVANKDTIHITVSDNGAGIAVEHIEKIFSDFYTTKSPEKGTGIGLSTVKKIVEEKLCGTVTCESTKENGTNFSIAFPAMVY